VSLMAHVRKAGEELASRRAGHPRIGAELAVARLMRRERALAWGEVEAALARVEAAMGNGPGRPPGASPVGALAAGALAAGALAAGALATGASAGDISRPVTASRPAYASSEAARPAAPGSPGLAMAEVVRRWPELLERLNKEHPAMHVYMMNARVAAVEGGALVLEVSSQFHREGLAKPDLKAKAEGFLSDAFGRSVRLAVREPSGPRPAVRVPGVVPQVGPVARPDWVEHEPLVKSALDMFKARIVPQKKQEPERP